MEYKKEIEVEIKIDGVPLQGTSFITVENGIVDYSQAEEHFYEIIRKWEKQWIDEWKSEYKEKIIDNLTKEQEDKLRDLYPINYHVTDEVMSNNFKAWLEYLSYDELLEYIK